MPPLRSRRLLLVLLVSLSATLARAEELPLAKPAEVGMSAKKLAEIQPTLQRFVDQKKVAGAIALVARQGKIVHLSTAGNLGGEEDVPMNADTLVRIYSMSKPITSVAIMMLVEDGKLQLDDPVSKHLPPFKGLKVFKAIEDGQLKTAEAGREVTIRDLLRHTSGLTYGFFGNTEVDKRYRAVNVLDQRGTLAEMIDKLGQLPLADQPGTRFRYSVSTDVLGRVVEVASEQNFDEFLKQRIFQPLQMNDTGFHVPESKRDRFASNFGPRLAGAGLRVTDDRTQSRYLRETSFPSGGGGLVSTARDYMRFCQMLLNKGQLDGKRLLKPETVKAMTKNQLPEQAYPIALGEQRDGVGFGLGFSVVVEKTDYTRREHVGEYGWGGAASTHFWISPRDELAVVVLTQLQPFSFQLEHAIKPIVYDAIEE